MGHNPKKQEIGQLIKSTLEQASLQAVDGSSEAKAKTVALNGKDGTESTPQQQSSISSESTEVLGGVTKSDKSAVVLVVAAPGGADKSSAEQLTSMYVLMASALLSHCSNVAPANAGTRAFKKRCTAVSLTGKH